MRAPRMSPLGPRNHEELAQTSSSDSLGERILEQAAEAVVYANREGSIERWNAAATAMFGCCRVEALGQSLDLTIPEHLRKAPWRGFDAAMANGKTRLGGRPTITRALRKVRTEVVR